MVCQGVDRVYNLAADMGMCRHFQEDFGLEVTMARFHNLRVDR